jgi:hypothetical protein
MNLHVWLTKTRSWLNQLWLQQLGTQRRNRAFLQPRSSFVEVMEQRVLLTSGHTDGDNFPGEYFYSLADRGYVYDSDQSRIWVDDSDIVKLPVNADRSWHHELYFDGSDVGLTSNSEDIDAFAMRTDGSLLISTIGGVSVAGVRNSTGGDLLRFVPTSTGNQWC